MKIVIVDSGVRRSHPILKGKRIESLQYEQGSVVPAPWNNDSYGHGTAVAAIISQCHADAELTVIGIPGLEEGLEESDLIWVLRYIRETQHADIVNLSLGLNVCEQYEDLYQACRALTDDGTVILSAFDNLGAISYPAAFDNVIGVISGQNTDRTCDFEFIEDPVVNLGAKGGLQRVAWSQPDYIMIRGNSFACAHATVQAVQFMSEGVKTREALLERFREIAIHKYEAPSCVPSSGKRFEIERAALFPFNKEMHSLVRYHDLLSFQICEIYDTKYSSTVGATTAHLLKDDSVQNILIKNISNIDWDRFDTLILGHTDELSSLVKLSDLKDSLIEQALQRKKKVYSFDAVPQYENNENVYFPCVREVLPNRFGMLYHLSKPVLGVFGTSSRQGKFTLQLKLRQMLLAAGYKVGQIGTEPSSLLYGMDDVFPMGYHSTVSIQGFDVIKYLNDRMNALCRQQKDIILVGSQSGSVTFDFGNLIQYNIPQYEFLVGTHPDAVILCVNPYDSLQYIERTIDFIESSVGCEVISLVVFPMDIRDGWAGIYSSKQPLAEEKYRKIKEMLSEKFEVPVFRLGAEEDMRQLFQVVVEFF